MKKILIVEDESLVALELASSLEFLGFHIVGIASNSKDAIALTCKHLPDLILMDICLKGQTDGIETVWQIKQKYNPFVIYMTALSGEEDIQRAVDTNPSAYILKPFKIQALKAAIEIAFHTQQPSNFLRGDIVFDDEFSFDSSTNQLICNGVFSNLTKKESDLLILLLKSANTIVTSYDIENEIWPHKAANISTVRALVSRLRAKLKYKFIETLPSLGYRITLHSKNNI